MAERITLRDIIMDIVIGAAVGIQIYMTLDEMTDGRFSRDLSMKVVTIKGRIKEAYDRERIVRKDTGRVIFDAITTVEQHGNTNQDGTGA